MNSLIPNYLFFKAELANAVPATGEKAERILQDRDTWLKGREASPTLFCQIIPPPFSSSSFPYLPPGD